VKEDRVVIDLNVELDHNALASYLSQYTTEIKTELKVFFPTGQDVMHVLTRSHQCRQILWI
jgi:hypothetical protein